MFEEFIETLRQRLSEPLPGKEAQKMMAPVNTDQRRFNLEDYEASRLGGVLILLYEQDGTIRFPLMERPVYPGIHSGQISLPGGKMEDQDQTLVETALRESREELGINPDLVSVIGSLSDLYITVSKIKVKPIVSFCHSIPEFTPDHTEVKRLLVADLFKLLEDSNRKEREIVVERDIPEGRFQYKLQAPYFDVNGEVVWGATAMILSELVAIVKEIH